MLNEDVGKLGAGGMRAVATAFLGTGPNFNTGPYKLLQSIRLWKCFVGDDGAAGLVRGFKEAQHRRRRISFKTRLGKFARPRRGAHSDHVFGNDGLQGRPGGMSGFGEIAGW